MAVAAAEAASIGEIGMDTEEDAMASGVDTKSVMSAVSSGISLASTIYNFVRFFKKYSEMTEDQKRQRLEAGIVFPNENRKTLINEGKIPAYYSSYNIKELLLKNLIPWGWSLPTLVSQGFGREATLMRLRQQNILNKRFLEAKAKSRTFEIKSDIQQRSREEQKRISRLAKLLKLNT